MTDEERALYHKLNDRIIITMKAVSELREICELLHKQFSNQQEQIKTINELIKTVYGT